jgi:hypothetical protein
MIFTAQSQPQLCTVCGVNPGPLKFEIHSAELDNSQQRGSCCATCGHQLLDALAHLKPSSSKTARQGKKKT